MKMDFVKSGINKSYFTDIIALRITEKFTDKIRPTDQRHGPRTHGWAAL